MVVQRKRVRWAAGAVAVAALAMTAGCTSAPSAAPSASPVAPATSASGESTSVTPSPGALVVDITIANGQVNPSGEKLTATVGQQVVLHVTSDADDEVHAHTGGDGYELEVPAGKTTTGAFSLTQPGSFEIESHHLEKIIVILNVS